MKPDFLSVMAKVSRERVALARRDESFEALRRRARGTPRAPTLRLREFDLIAEVKLAAPSSDAPVAESRIAERVRAYAAGGACAISVLTEPTRFAGSLAHLREAARTAGDVPVLRKDFVTHPYQVLEARAAGAGGVLLIGEVLDDVALDACLRTARELGMFVLLEAFAADQVDRALRYATDPNGDAPVLCGVNCRDLRTLHVDPAVFERAASRADRAPAVAESGMHAPDDVEAVARLGYRAALVGTALMRADDPEALAARMLAAGRRGRCASV